MATTADAAVLARLETIESLVRNTSVEDEFRDLKTVIRELGSQFQGIRNDIMELQRLVLSQTTAD